MKAKNALEASLRSQIGKLLSRLRAAKKVKLLASSEIQSLSDRLKLQAELNGMSLLLYQEASVLAEKEVSYWKKRALDAERIIVAIRIFEKPVFETYPVARHD